MGYSDLTFGAVAREVSTEEAGEDSEFLVWPGFVFQRLIQHSSTERGSGDRLKLSCRNISWDPSVVPSSPRMRCEDGCVPICKTMMSFIAKRACNSILLSRTHAKKF